MYDLMMCERSAPSHSFLSTVSFVLLGFAFVKSWEIGVGIVKRPCCVKFGYEADKKPLAYLAFNGGIII